MTNHKLTHPGNILLTGFGALLIMMSVLVYLSVKQKIPMVSQNYYEQELKYQDKLDAMNNTNGYDNLFKVQIEADHITLQLPSALSSSLQDGSAYFYCSSNEAMDHKDTLQANTDGTYVFDSKVLQAKRYVLKISFTADGKAYYKEIPVAL